MVHPIVISVYGVLCRKMNTWRRGGGGRDSRMFSQLVLNNFPLQKFFWYLAPPPPPMNLEDAKLLTILKKLLRRLFKIQF